MAIEDIKDINKLKNMLKEAQNEIKYLKACCEQAGLELAKNSFAYDYKEKNLVVQAMDINKQLWNKELELKEKNQELTEELQKSLRRIIVFNELAEKFQAKKHEIKKLKEKFKQITFLINKIGFPKEKLYLDKTIERCYENEKKLDSVKNKIEYIDKHCEVNDKLLIEALNDIKKELEKKNG